MNHVEGTQDNLCIEGDCETAALIAEELINRGFAVDVADGLGGIAAILQQTPDLVLCDISMPFMSGFDVLERLTEVAPGFGYMPFVFLTALTDHENELKGRRLVADDTSQNQSNRCPLARMPRATKYRELRTRGMAVAEAVFHGAEQPMRPLLMTAPSAAVGLSPAAIVSWRCIGSRGAAAPRHCRRRRHDDWTFYVADRRARLRMLFLRGEDTAGRDSDDVSHLQGHKLRLAGTLSLLRSNICCATPPHDHRSRLRGNRATSRRPFHRRNAPTTSQSRIRSNLGSCPSTADTLLKTRVNISDSWQRTPVLVIDLIASLEDDDSR